MLSVLVPVYNTDVRSLAEELRLQIAILSGDAEVIFLDDGSAEQWKKLNRTIRQDDHLRYLESETNLGRSAIRNKLAGLAKYSSLLFLDGDSVIIRKNFLDCYIAAIKNTAVVCGGRVYGSLSIGRKDWALHRKYGLKREQIPAMKRNANPWRSFMTNNFLIPRDILQNIGFDEQISGYGHEDTLFGFQLKLKGIPVIHIDNPVEHGILDTNMGFLEKSLIAAENLAEIRERIHEPAFDQEVGLLSFHLKLQKLHLGKTVVVFIRIFRKYLRRATVSKFNSLFSLDLLKYGAFYTRQQKLSAKLEN